jgi:poly(A) polymerase
MAINLETGKLIDPYNGLRDLQLKILRTPLDPHISFSEDPLRMMRAARFISRFNLTLDKGIKESVNELKERLRIVSNERIRDELNKLLITPDPNPGFKFLLKTKLYETFLPELKVCKRQHRIRYLRHDHCIRLAALLINISSEVRKARLKDLKYSNREIDTIDNLVSASQMILGQPMDDAHYRKWYLHAGENRQGSIEIASMQRGAGKKIAAIRRKARHLDQELEDYTPPFTGSEIISIMSLPQGPEVGEVLQLLENMFIESGPVSNQEALDFLAEWEKGKDNSKRK